jgi:hypothetical protein
MHRACHFSQCDSEVVPRFRVRLPQRDRLTIRGNCFLISTHLLQRDAEVVVGFGPVWFEPDGVARRFDGFERPAHDAEDSAEVGVEVGNVRTQYQRLPHQSLGDRVIPLLVAEHAEQVQGISVP